MNMRDSESLDDFCLKLNGLVTNMHALGDEMAESYVVKKVLRAMPQKFLQVMSTIEQFGDLEKMTIKEVIGSLKGHDERLCGQTETTGVECKKRKLDKKFKEQVNIAQIPDDEPALLLAEKENGKGNALMLNKHKVSPRLNQNKVENKFVSNLWYLDNGASKHMTGKRSKFKELNKEITGQIKFGDSSVVHIKGMGSIAIKCKTGEERILHQIAYGLPNLNHTKEVCTGCLMSKQTKKSYPLQSNYSATKVLELVHGDLCGPVTPSTKVGSKYVFLLVDDYSRVMWAYLLKSKDEAFEAFRKFRAQVEDGLEKKIKTFRTDRGRQFCSK
ncbi:uncharacterized protein LOC141713776 [Apium graveolens]|uniref:uncharacterized protein LOC141713776 n=1 Tax=Apium graveolens TaxID=4045 RepID=UPI003D7B33A2